MGELARQPDAPFFADTPLEVLTPREKEGYTWLDKNWIPFIFGSGGLAMAYYHNRVNLRPAWAGIYKYFIAGYTFYWIGKKVRDVQLEASAEKAAIYKHYVMLHPEDFPPIEKKRIKDLYIPWNPVR